MNTNRRESAALEGMARLIRPSHSRAFAVGLDRHGSRNLQFTDPNHDA